MDIMEKYFVDSRTDKIDLEDDQWVSIKSQLSIADQDMLKRSLIEVEIDATPGLNRSERRRRQKAGESNTSIKIRPSTIALLEVAIVDWSFVDNDNNKLPITTEWIGRLKPEWANLIEDAVEERNSPLQAAATPQ